MSIFPSNPSVNDEFSGYRWNGEVWEVIGLDLNVDYATETDFNNHTSASTTVHGIANVASLAELSDVATASAAAVASGSALAYASASAYTDSSTEGLVSGSGITNIVALTQAQYDALTPNATTLYVVTD